MILVIGAGASGLMAARDLLTSGKEVLVLEAAGRLGGRIHTLHAGFPFAVEAGAEFVHGDLPLTFELLNAAGITATPTEGKFYRSYNGEWQKDNVRVKGWDQVMEKMGSLEADMAVAEFLDTYFGGEANERLRWAVRRFAEGYDLADINFASTKALYREWSRDEGTQYHVDGGYGPLMDWMDSEIQALGGNIMLNAPVASIHWAPGAVTAHIADGRSFNGASVLITVPLGVLQAGDASVALSIADANVEPQRSGGPARNGLTFDPAIPEYIQAFNALGYGSVIKLLLHFREPFWEKEAPGLGFIVSDQVLPTWWTVAGKPNLLTGWFAGPRTIPYQGKPEAELVDLGLESLSKIFHVSIAELRAQLLVYRVDDWSQDPYSLGAYSYEKVGEAPFRKVLHTPVDNTLFFAGEALYEGEHTPGTVEAALATGRKAARAIIS